MTNGKFQANSPIFIVGCARSGTTLLRLLLNQHSRVAIPGETWYFPDINEKYEEIIKIPEKLWRDAIADYLVSYATYPEFGVNRKQIRTQLENLNRNDWSRIVAVVNITLAHKEGKPRWGDKTPGYCLHLPLIKKLYPDAYVINIIRDGRDVALSLMEYKNIGPQSILEAAYYWSERVKRARIDGRNLFSDSYMDISYERLVDEPENTLKCICKLIKEDYEPEMFDYYKLPLQNILPEHAWHNQTKGPIKKEHTRRWQNNMTKNDLCVFELVSGRLLRTLGYINSGCFSFAAWKEWIKYCNHKLCFKSMLRTKIVAYKAFKAMEILNAYYRIKKFFKAH